MSGRDPRITPARPDLAASHLEGVVEAERFVAGARRVIAVGVADLRRRPRADSPLETQALHGDSVMLYEEDEGWGWVQLEADGYVGYVMMDALGPSGPAPTHDVVVNRTFVYPAADMKRPVVEALPLGARLTIDRSDSGFAHLARGGFVVASHLAPVDDHGHDFVTIAEQLLHTPYLWGGKSPLGIDCSGLVQLAMRRTGQAVPRDTDMQERDVGEALPIDAGFGGLQRGDLVFWRGHVGIMRDVETLLHANAHHMLVASEPLMAAARRILTLGQAHVTAIKRINNK